jgi:hypothetical protein
MVPTHGVLRMLEAAGFRNLRGWTHGVDTTLFLPAPCRSPTPWAAGTPGGAVRGPGVVRERTSRPSCKLDLPGTKVVCGVGPLEADLRQRFPQCAGWACCRAMNWPGVCRGRRVRLSQPLGNLRPGDAGGHGQRHARGGLPGGRPAGGAGPRPPARAARCTKTCNRPALPRWPCRATRHARRAGFQLGRCTQLFASYLVPARHRQAPCKRHIRKLSHHCHQTGEHWLMGNRPVTFFIRHTFPSP